MEDLLPNAGDAIIDLRKLTEYVLNWKHPVGGNKARVFESTLGFTRDDVGALAAQIRSGVLSNPAVSRGTRRYGSLFAVDIPVVGPKGRGIVRRGWIVDLGAAVPRLVTAYVR